MIYPYLTLADGTEIVHTHLFQKDGQDVVEVHFEKPVDDGFKSARCELPSYHWLFNKGYSEDEIKFFTEFLEHNAHLIFRYASTGGLKLA